MSFPHLPGPPAEQMNRTINGVIRRSDGSGWPGAQVTFELERSSYDDEAQYPAEPVRVVTDEDGALTVTLWINKTGFHQTRYICTLPDSSQFRFDLEPGSSPLTMKQLRASAVEDDSPYRNRLAALLPVLREEIAAELQGLSETIDQLNGAIEQLQSATANLKISQEGVMELGSNESTPHIQFLTTMGETKFYSVVTSSSPEPSLEHFPENNSFGFFKTIHTDELKLVFNNGGQLKTLTFDSGEIGAIEK